MDQCSDSDSDRLQLLVLRLQMLSATSSMGARALIRALSSFTSGKCSAGKDRRGASAGSRISSCRRGGRSRRKSARAVASSASQGLLRTPDCAADD